MANVDCPFGVECERSKMVEIELLAVQKQLTLLASRVRLLQFIVIGGWLLDFVVGSKAQAVATLAFMGR